ncbi:MAG: hypothetical protein ACR2F2_08105 [Pyrinomonadaceae bacterium]
MNKATKIVVEAIIPCDVETLWARSQEPDLHILWDIRFSHINYLEKLDEKGFRLLDYRTKIGFGLEIKGIGRYLQNTPLKHSTFEFESDDWKSLIKIGRGIWQYKSCAEGTYFRTVYDYETNYGFFGKFIDRILFRPMMQLATEWGFETLRRWCVFDDCRLQIANSRLKEKSEIAPMLKKRTSKFRFALFFAKRYFGFPAKKGEANSWLGNGQESYLKPNFQDSLRVTT